MVSTQHRFGVKLASRSVGADCGRTAPTWQLLSKVLGFCPHGHTQVLQQELVLGWLQCLGHAAELWLLVPGRAAEQLVSCLAVVRPW